MSTLEDFAEWLKRDIARFGATDTHVQEMAGSAMPGENCRRVRFYTIDHVYSVSAVERDGEPGYLGCIASKRAPLAGEDHTRGSDLADGPLSEETWHSILGDIVSYELQPLDIRPATPLPDEAVAA